MKYRCLNQNSPRFKDYGGRGIVVCERWRNSFDAYVEDLGSAPSPKHTVDRTDNDGPYSPENCRWVSKEIQSHNRRSNRLLELNGKKMLLCQWVKLTGLSRRTITARIDWGWSIKEALTTPVNINLRCNKKKALVKISACGA